MMSVESGCFRLAFGYPDPPDCDCSFHDWTDRHSEAEEGLDRGARRQLLPSFPPLFRRRQHARQGKDFCWKFDFIQGRTRTAFTLNPSSSSLDNLYLDGMFAENLRPLPPNSMEPARMTHLYDGNVRPVHNVESPDRDGLRSVDF